MHNIAFKNECDLPCRHIMFKFIAINAHLWKLSHKKSYAFDVTTTNDSVHYASCSNVKTLAIHYKGRFRVAIMIQERNVQ